MHTTWYGTLFFTISLVLASSMSAAESGANTGPERPEAARSIAVDPDNTRQAPREHELLIGNSRAAPPGTNGFGDGPDCPVTVGPGPECDFDDLQLALNAAAGGNNCGHFAVTSNYSMISSYLISTIGSWETPSGTPGWLMGGFPDCSDPDPDGELTTTVLDLEHLGQPLAIVYSADEFDPFRALRIENFELFRGASGAGGGGLWIWGTPGRLAVELINVEITASQAAESGGGIHLEATGDGIVDDPDNPPPPMLFIDDDSEIRLNEAEEKGGGIYCENSHDHNNAVMLRTGAGLISENQATDGGGVALSNCTAVMRNGGPLLDLPMGLFAQGGINRNEADNWGGGLFAEDGTQAIIEGELSDSQWGGDPDNSGLFRFNEAGIEGGGIYLTGEDTWLSATRTTFVANEATFGGGGIYLQDGARFDLTADNDPDVGCHPNFGIFEEDLIILPPCNLFLGNSSAIAGGGAVVRNGSELYMHNAYILENHTEDGSASVILASSTDDDSPGFAQIVNSVAAGNYGGSRVFFATNGGLIDVRWSTVADNVYSESLFHAGAGPDRWARYEIRSSIVWQDDGENMATRGGDGSTIAFSDCVIGFEEAEETDLTSTDFYSQIDPEFRDSENMNYRLSTTSPAINYCDIFSGPPDHDLDGRPRGEEYPHPITPPPNSTDSGIYDLGAFVAAPDELFGDRFEQE